MLTRFSSDRYTRVWGGQADDRDIGALFNSRESQCTQIEAKCFLLQQAGDVHTDDHPSPDAAATGRWASSYSRSIGAGGFLLS